MLLGFDKFMRDNNFPDVSLYIIGDGPAKAHTMKLANCLQSCNHIIFTGTMPEPFGYIAGAMANVLSTPHEGLGMTLVEAAVCKTLNIASDAKSGPREILMNGDAGLLFPTGDFDALAARLTDVYNKKIDCKKMIDNATRGLSRFKYETIAKKVLDLLKG
jgi:glycosyltransferase involved in cell wall biosynthesis